jgi:hypothetical protein
MGSALHILARGTLATVAAIKAWLLNQERKLGGI